MSALYRTVDGDVIDAVALAHYGSGSDAHVSAILKANPHIRDSGPVLEAGHVLTLPDAAEIQPAMREQIRLWS